MRLALLLGLVALLPVTAHAQLLADSSAAMARAQQLREWVRAGDAARLWTAMSPGMQVSMKDSTTFAATTQGIRRQVGSLDSVLTEKLTGREGLWLYRAEARFSDASDPLQLSIAVDADGQMTGLLLRPGERPKEYPSANLDYQTRTSLRLPFEGEWFVFWGGRSFEQNHHASVRAQRFAVDLVIRRDGVTHQGEGRSLTDYHCYGARILAPAPGTVVWSDDGHPDQTIGTSDPVNPIGNGLVLDHGNGEYSLFAHLQPGTQKFKKGDRVAADEELGRCGNSGNTSEPHLHYQLQSGADPVESDGLPAFFSELSVNGEPVPRAELLRGQQVKRSPAKTAR